MTEGDEKTWRALLDRLQTATYGERILLSLAALALSILVGALVVVISGIPADCGGALFCYNPIEVYYELFFGAIGGNPLGGDWSPTNFSMATTLQTATILLFTGLSVAVAFQAGMFNIGTQGQLVLGSLATAVAVLYAAPYLPGGAIGTLLLIPVGVFAGAVIGGVWGAIPGALKAYADANEVITTIMLNFVATGISAVLLSQYFQDQTSPNPQTPAVPDYAEIPHVPVVGFDPRIGFSLLALLFAVALIGVVHFVLRQTSFGYDLRTSGKQPEAAEYGGVDSKRLMVSSMTLSGALGGIGGSLWVLMVHGRWLRNVPSFGFDGITVSILAGNNPLGVGFAALLFGVLKSGSRAIDTATGVPPQLVDILSGLIILFVAMPEFFRMLGRYYRRTQEPTVAADGGETDE
jgi:simple sugar transport system permease protein